MVFERSLIKPPANWNISGNKLLYKEHATSDEIHLVKLSLKRQPVVFKIQLPKGLTHGLEKSRYEQSVDNFVIDSDEELPKEEEEGKGKEQRYEFRRMDSVF